MFRDEEFSLDYARDSLVVGLQRNDYQERLRQIERVGKNLARLAIEVGPRPYDGTYVEGEGVKYKITSKEAHESVEAWLSEGVITKGHVNRMKGEEVIL